MGRIDLMERALKRRIVARFIKIKSPHHEILSEELSATLPRKEAPTTTKQQPTGGTGPSQYAVPSTSSSNKVSPARPGTSEAISSATRTTATSPTSGPKSFSHQNKLQTGAAAGKSGTKSNISNNNKTAPLLTTTAGKSGTNTTTAPPGLYSPSPPLVSPECSKTPTSPAATTIGSPDEFTAPEQQHVSNKTYTVQNAIINKTYTIGSPDEFAAPEQHHVSNKTYTVENAIINKTYTIDNVANKTFTKNSSINEVHAVSKLTKSSTASSSHLSCGEEVIVATVPKEGAKVTLRMDTLSKKVTTLSGEQSGRGPIISTPKPKESTEVSRPVSLTTPAAKATVTSEIVTTTSVTTTSPALVTSKAIQPTATTTTTTEPSTGPKAPLAVQETFSPTSVSSPAQLPPSRTSISSHGTHRFPTPGSLTVNRPAGGIQIPEVPKFYFPKGRPISPTETDLCLKRVSAIFNNFEGGKVKEPDLPPILKAAEIPLYWKKPVFLRCRSDDNDFITFQQFKTFWLSVTQDCHDEASRFIHILGDPSRDYLIFEDFIPMIQDIVDTHPGLTFLREAIEFHSRYVHTVISRIFFASAKPWSKHLTGPMLRKSNLLPTVRRLEEVEDINQITDYFSYEHFYVIYCKFWELDRDHDLVIDKNDLSRHNEYAVSSKIVDRVLCGAVTSDPRSVQGKMAYPDFVWFLMAEEDKRNPTSVEYWFRCMDIDGDGILSFHELQMFYDEQVQRLESRGIEPIPFIDILCQLIDVVRPRDPTRISLADLKSCRMCPLFFDTFINIEKYLDMERQDGAACYNDDDGLTDWERFAAEEYEALVAEESAAGGDLRETEMCDEDFDSTELSSSVSNIVSLSSSSESNDKTASSTARPLSDLQSTPSATVTDLAGDKDNSNLDNNGNQISTTGGNKAINGSKTAPISTLDSNDNELTVLTETLNEQLSLKSPGGSKDPLTNGVKDVANGNNNKIDTPGVKIISDELALDPKFKGNLLG